MALYRIDITNGSETGSVVPDVGWRYNLSLNSINEAELKFSGTGATIRQLMVIGATVQIYKNGTLAFKGLIDNTDYFVGGTVVFHASGYEVWLAKENGAYASSPWTSTASATILAAIIGESSYLSAGTINAGFSLDYRLSNSSSIFNAISNLANKTSQDISIDYATAQVSILDHVGSTTSVAVLNEGKEITNVRRSIGYPRGNNIVVWGKGDGANQIKGAANDATSIAAYGTITKNVIDRSVASTSEANRLATAELALNKDPPNIYDFDLTNPDNGSLNLGDVITLNALDQDVNNEEVRIVGIIEGDAGGKGQYITLQTTNPELKTLMRTKNKILARIKKDADDQNSYMQGSGNLSQWEGGINAKSTAGLKIRFNVNSRFFDEMGNRRIDALTIDYDVDEYRRGVGDATETDENPSIDNATVSSDDNESYEVTNNDSYSSSSTLYNSWTTYWDINNIGSHGQAIIFNVHVIVYDWDTAYEDSSLYCRIKHVDLTDYYPNSGGVRLCRGHTGEDNTTDSDSHFHEPATRRYFGVSDDLSTWYGNTGTDSDSHNHDVSSYPNLDGTTTIYVPLDPYLQDFDVQLDTTSGGNGLCSYQMTYMVVSQHEHGDGDYRTRDHNHNVSVGDAISDAGSVNATNITAYLEQYVAPNWVTRVTYTPSPGNTLELDRDMTGSGVYPNVTGWWRIRIITNSATPDYIQAIVNIKHNLDN